MPLISVITRTKDRPALLMRAGRSLAQQTCRDFVWIVTNDSADETGIAPALETARQAGIAVRGCQVTNSKGMESASNQGLALADTPYVTFLDDDDTWEPEFLGETLSYLEARPDLGGVCTQTSIVEETAESEPRTLRKYVMNADLESIQIADMMLFNHLTTNSLLYRRALHDRLGLFREDLPVMGDWEFGIRIVTAYDIGVVAKPLANYHRRVPPDIGSSSSADTATDRKRLHEETDARLRNEMLRKEWAAGTVGPGHLMALARIQLRADRLNRFNFDAVRADISDRLGTPEEASIGARLAIMAAQLDRLQNRVSPRWWLRRLFGRNG